MKYVLIPLFVIFAAMAVFSLIRGIVAFLNSTKEDLNRAPGDTRATEMQLLQNKMMFNRIKYQGLAIVVIAILLAVAR
jgi:hypothetical protein